MNFNKRWIWFIGCSVPVLAMVVVGVLAARYFFRWQNTPAFRVAQAQLERASLRDVTIYRLGGFPRFVGTRVPVDGEDEVAQAFNYLTSYSDLYFSERYLPYLPD